MFSALKHSYNKSDFDTIEALENIPIIHVHGSLGPLIWQDEIDGNEYHPLFTGRKNLNEGVKKVRVASKNIKIVSENQSQSAEFELAFEYLKKAERIYFLGFGYHPTNMERLQLHALPQIRQLRKTYYDDPIRVKHSPMEGAALGLENAEINYIQNKWFVRLPDNNSDALLFLRKYARLD